MVSSSSNDSDIRSLMFLPFSMMAMKLMSDMLSVYIVLGVGATYVLGYVVYWKMQARSRAKVIEFDATRAESLREELTLEKTREEARAHRKKAKKARKSVPKATTPHIETESDAVSEDSDSSDDGLARLVLENRRRRHQGTSNRGNVNKVIGSLKAHTKSRSASIASDAAAGSKPENTQHA